MSPLTFLTLPVVHFHVNHPARLISQHHEVTSVSLGNRSQLCRFLVRPPQFATCKPSMSFAQNYTARFSLGARVHCKSVTFFLFLEVVLYFFFFFQIPSKSCCDSNAPSKTYSTITFITHSKCKWHISAFTLIHQGWHSHSVKPLNN